MVSSSIKLNAVAFTIQSLLRCGDPIRLSRGHCSKQASRLARESTFFTVEVVYTDDELTQLRTLPTVWFDGGCTRIRDLAGGMRRDALVIALSL